MKRAYIPQILCLVTLMLVLASCSKTEEIIIPGNTAPPDYTIDNLVKENYITRSYIALLSRKPDEAEFNEAFSILDVGNLSPESRELMLQNILDKDEFYDAQFLQWKGLLINGIDTSDIQNEVFILELLLTDPAYEPFYDRINYELNRLEELLSVADELKAGSIPFKELHRRLINNGIYDEINMGSQNHVISSFQFFLLRHPTEQELENSILMLEDFSSMLFFETGNSKDDYHHILFDSDQYYEAQARDLFLRFIFREPSSQEMVDFAATYKASEDYKELLRKVLSMDEYVGLE